MPIHNVIIIPVSSDSLNLETVERKEKITILVLWVGEVEKAQFLALGNYRMVPIDDRFLLIDCKTCQIDQN